MAFQNMIQEMLGVPGMNRGLAATKINEALLKIQTENVWSFQCKTGGWLTANLLGGPSAGSFLSPGTITVVPFTQTITADPVATFWWTKPVQYPPILTQQQIRVPLYALYDIIALGNNGTVAYATIQDGGSGQNPGVYSVPVIDNAAVGSGATVSITVNADGTVTLPPIVTNVGSGYIAPAITFSEGGTSATFTVTLIATITIDRPWLEPAQTNGPYCVYQAYYPVPANFRRFFAIRDTTNNEPINWWDYTQIDLSEVDPQREIFDQPEYAVPFDIDTRPGSATYGQGRWELWPAPISQLPYTFQCQCNWPPLQQNNDTLPYPLTEELVKFRTYQVLALWKESQKGTDEERGSGANWQFLWKANQEEYKDDLRQIRLVDKNLMELYYTKARQGGAFNGGEAFTNTNGTANVGWF